MPLDTSLNSTPIPPLRGLFGEGNRPPPRYCSLISPVVLRRLTTTANSHPRTTSGLSSSLDVLSCLPSSALFRRSHILNIVFLRFFLSAIKETILPLIRKGADTVDCFAAYSTRFSLQVIKNRIHFPSYNYPFFANI